MAEAGFEDADEAWVEDDGPQIETNKPPTIQTGETVTDSYLRKFIFFVKGLVADLTRNLLQIL